MKSAVRKRWFKLDNAGKLYPAIATSRWSSVFRITAVLRENVVPSLLQKAADAVLPRFPTMNVCLRRGFFWYYLETNARPFAVHADVGHPCLRFDRREDNGYLIRVLYDRRRISVEFFHAVTDGHGGLVFLKTLVAEYLRLKGARIQPGAGVLNPKDKPAPAEMEDAFQHVPLPKVRLSRRETSAYRLPGDAEPPHTLHVIAASMPYQAVRALSQPLGVTVTEYLASALLYAAYRQQRASRRKQRPLRVSIPVNLRSFYPTATLRNFSFFVNPEIDPRLGDYTFEEIAGDVHAFMRYALNQKRLFAGIAANVADERRLLLRLAPLPLKNLVINTVFRRVGDRPVTTTLSSIGRVDGPASMMARIERFELQLGVPALPGCNSALVTTGETMVWMFTRNQREADLPREALKFLVERGVPVTVESNQE